MASGILDIIHRISYEVTGQSQIQAITTRLNDNVQSIGRNVASLARLQQQLNATSDPKRQELLTQAIRNRTAAINEQGQAIQTAIQNDRTLQRSLQQEIGIINELNGRLNSLRQSRDAATSTQELQRLTQQIAAVERQRSALNAPTANPAARLSLTAARPNANSNVLASGATPAAVASVRALTQELGVINQLNRKLGELREARNRALNSREIQAYNRQIRDIERQQQRLLSGSTLLGNAANSILQGIGIGSGIQIFDTVIGKLGQFISDASRMAAEVEGVRPAFERLNDPNLLNNLRAATKGTLSDLELMKSAVQFSNFGLPINRMADALKFARIRARETGQDVNYLVQSIVTGIGRQSPLILDNLGINVKRVRDEFAKTGDFAQAAFNIISEEANKSGQDLDTFTEKIGRLNATLDNSKSTLGKDLNEIIELFGVLGRTALDNLSINPFRKFNDEQLRAYKELTEQREQQDRIAEEVQDKTNTTFIFAYQRFLNEYAKSDQTGRDKILEQARAMNDGINAQARAAYQQGTDQLQIYLQGQAGAFQKFLNQIKAIPIKAELINKDNVRGLTREQLQAAQEANDLRRNILTGRDEDKAKEIAATDKLIKDQLDIINGTVKKVKIKAPKVEKIDFDKLRRDIKNGYFKLIKDINDDIDNNAADSLVIPALQRQAATPFNVLQSDLNNEEKVPSLDVIKLRAHITLAQDIRKFEEAAKQKQLDKDKERDQERVDSSMAAYNAISQNAYISINSILDAQIRAAEKEIQYRTGTVEKAKELALRGNTEVLKAEEDQLAKATAARDAAAQRQLELNALLQASNMAVALSEAIGAIVSAATKGDPYTIAARVIAAVAALVGGVASLSSAFSSSSQGFFTGGYTGDGQKMQEAGTVHKGEFVFNKETTSKHRELFEAIHKGQMPLLPVPSYPMYLPSVTANLGGYKAKDFKSLESKLDGVIDAVNNLEINANQSMDSRGLNQEIELVKRRERNSFR